MPPLAGVGDAGRAARRQIAVAGGAGDIDLAARTARPPMAPPLCSAPRSWLQTGADVISPLAYLPDDGIAVLHAGDIEAAIAAGRGGAT